MTDEKIVEMFWARDERALNETQDKYKDLCMYVGAQILASNEDREECVSDAMLALWNQIPPDDPKSLSAYLAAIVRTLALERSRDANAWKRGGQVQIVGEEFLSMIEDDTDISAAYEAKRAGELISRFLRTLPKTERKMFIMRYWLDMSNTDIAKQLNFGESRVKVTLHRIRKKLAAELGKEGITV